MQGLLIFAFSCFIFAFLIDKIDEREQVYLETMPCQVPMKEGDSTTGKLVRKPDGTLWLMCSYTNHRADLKHTM